MNDRAQRPSFGFASRRDPLGQRTLKRSRWECPHASTIARLTRWRAETAIGVPLAPLRGPAGCKLARRREGTFPHRTVCVPRVTEGVTIIGLNNTEHVMFYGAGGIILLIIVILLLTGRL
jgi:hypothetical protein